MSSEMLRDPLREPWHPNPQTKAQNPFITAAACRASQLAALNAAQRAVDGDALTGDAKAAAGLVVAALSEILGQEANTHLTLLVEGVSRHLAPAPVSGAEAVA